MSPGDRARLAFAAARLADAEKQAGLKIDASLEHPESFRLNVTDGKVSIEGGSAAGVLYGVGALLEDQFIPGRIEKPDLPLRGTTLCLMSGGGRYKSTLSPEIFPWFYDKAFMTRTLDALVDARINTIYVWAGHLFPYIVEMPEYPEASADVPPGQVRANQQQFRWFTAECEKRNIQVLLHFYNIHVSPPFARKHGISEAPTTPTPLLREYTYHALSRYFEEFASVGLYACPGESIHSRHQLEWFRDVIFKAARDSGKKPIIVMRDWTLNMEFKNQLKALYGRIYSELKHHDESMTSPYPDVRHLKWEGLTHGHIINAGHGPAQDLAPIRWASPAYVQEQARHWQSLGFVHGSEYWLQSFWHWPHTLDQLTDAEPGSVRDRQGRPRLLYLDRDAPFITLIGRAMWKADRDPATERAFWEDYHARRWNSEEIGRLMAEWYDLTGPISPGLQNLNATRVANFWSALMLTNQNVDQILGFSTSLTQTPYTLHREAGRAQQRTYPRPFDAWFFDRYRAEYGLPKPGDKVEMYEDFAPFRQRMGVADLAQRHVMPVRQYSQLLEEGESVTSTMTPDKAIRLLHKLSEESLELARKMAAASSDPQQKKELNRFATDSRIYVLATQAMIHKQDAAILKGRMLASGNRDHAEAFLREMEASVKAYEELVKVGDANYIGANDLHLLRWSGAQGLGEFREDLARQRKWVSSE
jgi:hypothetical protein